MGGNPTTFAGSDHGFGAAVLRGQREQGAERRDRPHHGRHRRLAAREQRATRSNCGAATTDLAKACWAGGTIQIYVNTTLPAGHRPTRRSARRSRTRSRTSPTRPTRASRSILKIMNKEELRNVDGSDSLHPNRSGDVVVVLTPAVPVGRGHERPGDRAVALLRAARLPAELRRPHEQHQHARDVRARAARASSSKDNVAGPAGDRRRPDARVPDGHPRPAERARPDPLRHRRGRRAT